MSNEVEIGRFITAPLKKSNDVDLVLPLETFIRNTYDKVCTIVSNFLLYLLHIHSHEFKSIRRGILLWCSS